MIHLERPYCLCRPIILLSVRMFDGFGQLYISLVQQLDAPGIGYFSIPHASPVFPHYSAFEHPVPYAVQAGQQEGREGDSLWRAGVCGGRRKDIHSLLGETQTSLFSLSYLVALFTVEHTYDACPKYSELGSLRIIAYLYVSDGSRRWQHQHSKKKV